MKKLKRVLTFLVTCILFVIGTVIFSLAAEITLPSETSAFVTNVYIGKTDQNASLIDDIYPVMKANIKENNKKPLTPYYEKFEVLNNPENFQGLGHATYANINGETVTAEAFYRRKNEAVRDPNVGQALLLFQCLQYKAAHPEEDVELFYGSYRTSVTYAVCVVPESRYYGYGRVLYGTNYDEQGFVRLTYLLAEAARMGIKVTLVTQLDSYGKNQYNPTVSSLNKYKGKLDHVKYFNEALKTDCYNKYAPGKKVSDFMNFCHVGWNVTDKTADMQHVKGAAVSHYLATDGTVHRNAIFMESSNLDDVDYNGSNGNNGSQSGVIISDHAELFRITKNYFNLMCEYSGREDMYKFRRIMKERNENQIALINSGRENEIPKDEQIVYLGGKNDPMFELYFTPFGGGIDTWDPVNNPICKYVNKLTTSEDSIEFLWNISGISDFNLGVTLKNVLEKAFYENQNVANKLSILYTDTPFEAGKLHDLNVGTQIGYKSIRDPSRIHAKDMYVSYVEDGVRHNVSLITSCNFYNVAYYYRANSFLVINETGDKAGSFYSIINDRASFGLYNKNLMASPQNLTLEPGQSYDLDVDYTGKKALTWTSSDNNVATVKNGKVTVVGKGSATITVTDGTDKYSVKVKGVACLDCVDATPLSFNINEQYVFEAKNAKMPYTFETTFSVDQASLTKTVTLLGNDGLFDPSLVFSLTKSGQPRVVMRNVASNSKQYTYTFSNVKVATGQKVHLAITLDFANKKAHCYIDGELKQSVSIGTFKAYEQKHNFVVGGDHKNGNATFFPGEIYTIGLWSDIRTAAEIKNDFSSSVDTADKELLVYYNLKRCEEHLVDDASAYDNDLEHIKLWLDKDEVEPVGNYEYSFAVIGDTQTMCEADPDAMLSIYDWIVKNKKAHKIEYVIGLGDITDDSTDGEWVTANKSFSKLDGVVPYALSRGNHDDWDDFNRNLHNGVYEKTLDGMMNTGKINLSDPVGQPGVLTNVDKNGNVSYITREEDVPEGGVVKGDLTNSYRYFNIQGTDYLIMTLDFAPSDKAIEWASKVIEAHPDHKVIVATHCYMYRDGTTLDAGDCYPASYYTGYQNAQDGDKMWEKCFSKYENVLMVLSGHDPWQHAVYRQDEGVNGNTVTQFLIDAQYVDRNIGATGMIAMFYFSNDGRTLTVRYYSVAKDCYGSELSNFTVCLEHNWAAATCTAPKTCKDCKATSGKALGHKYTNACDTSCNTCKATRKITHSYKDVVTKANLTTNGKIENKCSVCGNVSKTTTVYYPKTFSLSTTAYTYDGKAKTPSVTVKDSKSKTLKKDTDYTVEYESGRTNPGKYTVTIKFKGNYSGTKKLYFTIAPKATSKVTATQTTSSVKLSWSKVTGATGYRVYQKTSNGWKELKKVTATTYTVSKLNAGTKYTFAVKPYTVDGLDTVVAKKQTEIATSTKCATPTLKVTSTKKGAANLTWTNVSGETGYKVYYSTKKDSGFKLYSSPAANTTKATVSKLKSGTTYYFRVIACKTTAGSTVNSGYQTIKVKVK